MTTATVAFLDFITILGTFLLRVIRLADRLAFTMGPDHGHAGLWVADMANLVRKIGIQLTYC